MIKYIIQIEKTGPTINICAIKKLSNSLGFKFDLLSETLSRVWTKASQPLSIFQTIFGYIIIKKTTKLKKYNSRAIKCQVILMHENNQFTTELNLSIPRKKLNVKDTTDNLTKSIDRAVKKMIQRISRVKKKQRAIN